jgi:hypothetical protein
MANLISCRGAELVAPPAIEVIARLVSEDFIRIDAGEVEMRQTFLEPHGQHGSAFRIDRDDRPHFHFVTSLFESLDLETANHRAHGDQLYVPYSDGSLVALDLETGTERWRTRDGTQSFDWPPAASATSIFATAADALWAFDLHPLETASRREHDHR